MQGGENRDRGNLKPGERRVNARFRVNEEARLLVIGHGLEFDCRILDMSLEGCRLGTDKWLPDGICVRVEVTFTVNGIPSRMAGVIQRCVGGETGVQFLDMSARRQAEWAEVVTEVKETAEARVAEAAAWAAVAKMRRTNHR